MFIAGIAGYFLRRSDYSIPAIVMGVILGKIGETSMVQAYAMTGNSFTGFITEPIAGTFFVLGFLTIAVGLLRSTTKFFGKA